MIEIRADEDSKPVTPDGPHDHESTRAVASGIDEAMRLLNYATMSSYGLAYPSDVYSVLGSLSAALAKMPQALDQMSQWMAREVAMGRARENPAYGDHGGNAEDAVDDLRYALRKASDMAAELARHLDRAQSHVRGLESARG